MCTIHFFFFFQAEDGIRDGHVTGVQTCALPIYMAVAVLVLQPFTVERGTTGGTTDQEAVRLGITRGPRQRSEERRVGKECKCRGGPEQEKKKEERPRVG